MEKWPDSLSAIRACIVIPVYNHGKTLRTVVERALAVHPDVLVVDDGSTDNGPASIADLPIRCVHLGVNKGKGEAIKEASRLLLTEGWTHMVTLDADDQHYPEDVPAFLEEAARHPHAFIVGARDFTNQSVPASSRFGRKFCRFWMFVQTGADVGDMQSGFRAYPLHALSCLKLRESRYSFEIEVLVKAAWAGFAIREISVRVRYPEKSERISHFKAIGDNLRITLMNTRLTVRAMTPIPFRHHALDEEGRVSLLSPLASLQKLLRQSSPALLAKSAAVSLFICTLPLLGLQSIMLLFCINWLRLDRLCSLAIVPLSWFPAIPAGCMLLGHRLWHGVWLTEFSARTLGYQAGWRFLEWMLGAAIAAPFLGLAMWVTIRLCAEAIDATQNRTRRLKHLSAKGKSHGLE